MHQHRTLVGSCRFISGSICPSNPFERHRRFTSPSKRAASSQNFWRHSNTDAPVYLTRWAVSPSRRSHLSEREKKLLNRLAAPSSFQNFRPVDLWSPTDLSDIPTDLTYLWADLWSLASHALPGGRVKIRKWSTAAVIGTMAKHVQKPPRTMAKYVQKPSDWEGSSCAVVCRHSESQCEKRRFFCSLHYIDRVCFHEPSFTTDLAKSW